MTADRADVFRLVALECATRPAPISVRMQGDADDTQHDTPILSLNFATRAHLHEWLSAFREASEYKPADSKDGKWRNFFAHPTSPFALTGAHADRTRIMAPGQHLGLFSSNGVMKGSVLVDGFVRAGWRPIKDRAGTALAITPFDEPIRRQNQAPVTAEGLRLLAFLAPGEKHRVELGPVKAGPMPPPRPAAAERPRPRALPATRPAPPRRPRPPSGSTASRRPA